MKRNKTRPAIFIFSGPGGAGKTTLVSKLFRKKRVRENFLRTISVTSRAPRGGEKEGRDYFFVSRKEFLRLKENNFFLEWEKVLADYYGTPRSFYLRARKEKKGLILCIDVKGGVHLKKKLKNDNVVTIFISAPDKGELKRRLCGRRDRKDKIKKRLELAKKELQFSQYYDYLVINKNLKNTVAAIAKIVLEEQPVNN